MPDPEFPDSEGRLGLKAEWNGYNTEEWQPCSLTPVSVWSAVRLHQKAVPACRSPSLQKEAEEKVQEALGIQDDPYEIVTVDESLRTGEDGVALESYSQMAFTTKVSARAVDVLIGSEDYMDGFEFKDEYFMDLTKLLPEDVYQAFGKQDDKYSITIDSDELAEELEVTYEPVKIGVLANSENVENAVKWLTKLAEELS